MGIPGRLADGLFEEVRVHEVGAGAGDEVAAVSDQLHAAQIDLTVAARGGLDGIAGLGEGGRIEDDDVILLALLDQLGQKSEDVAAQEGDAVLDAVEPRVFPRLLHGQVRGVNGDD